MIVDSEYTSIDGQIQIKGAASLSGTKGLNLTQGLNAGGSVDLTSESGDINLAKADYQSGGDFAAKAGGMVELNGTSTERLAINAKGNLDIAGLAGINAKTIELTGDKVNLGSLGNIAITGGVRSYNSSNRKWQRSLASLISGNEINLTGGGSNSNIYLDNINLSSDGKTLINTTGDLNINPGTNYDYRSWTTSHKSGSFWNRKTTITSHVRENTRTQASIIKAGDIEINTGGDATFNTVKLESQKDVNIDIAGEARYSN